jgi:lysophospholipase L1-like esterase
MKRQTFTNLLTALSPFIRSGYFSPVLLAVVLVLGEVNPSRLSSLSKQPDRQHWIGTWAAAPQRAIQGRVQSFRNQTLRLVVHASAGGKMVRIKISNLFGDQPLVIGSAHIARRTEAANIDLSSDRILKFDKQSSVTIPAGSLALSDPVDLDVSALSDLAISLFFPGPTTATTVHILAQQTNYVSPEKGDFSAQTPFPVARTIGFWPFLVGVDVIVSRRGASVVAFGSSLTDGDGSTEDANRRWPDILAERLQKNGYTELGVLNEGIIGNRLLNDIQGPRQLGGPPPLGAVFEQLGPALGEAGLKRFERDVLSQTKAKYVIIGLGVNDILFPGTFVPARESVTSQDLIVGYRQLIARAHKSGIRVVGTTIPPFERALFRNPRFESFYTPEKEKSRQEVNTWILSTGEFDGVIDFDRAVRDPNHPTELLPAYDSGDHLHVNDAGNVAQGNTIPLSLFSTR